MTHLQESMKKHFNWDAEGSFMTVVGILSLVAYFHTQFFFSQL
jgi:hypothetical protein